MNLKYRAEQDNVFVNVYKLQDAPCIKVNVGQCSCKYVQATNHNLHLVYRAVHNSSFGVLESEQVEVTVSHQLGKVCFAVYSWLCSVQCVVLYTVCSIMYNAVKCSILHSQADKY